MRNHRPFAAIVRPLAAALASAGLLAAALSGCSDATGKAAATTPAAPPVSAALVLEKPVAETQEFSGRLEAVEQVEIRSRVSGFITAVNFKPGSEVKKGDVLFVVDPRPYQAEATRAAAAAASARAKLELARRELARAESLLADKAIAKREFDEALSAQKELEANANAAQAQYESARLNLADTRVVSPIDGRVSKAEITLGNLVDPSAVLTTVVSLDRIYASFDGDEETYLRVGARAQQGAPVTVRVGLANEAGFPHEGRLEFVDNRLDAGTGSVRMRAVFENRGRSLVPGLFARVQLGAADSRQAVLISDRAVSTDQSRKFVVVVDAANKAEYRQVALGPVIDGLRVVRSGLKAGEKIVVNGLQRVRPGEPLAPRMVPMEGQPALALAAATGAKE
ncbi:efflux RND transporter periplasmic adaptor subunit [Massilia sp. GCM10023247]|uniref:efflux RND transporter periplasmic adaptor subunit n=1 Tax=Massilia sp. GCM10023247 TaxID=3252643 RepID=UPI003605C124